MKLVQQLRAGRFIQKLKASRTLAPEAVAEARERLVALGPDALSAVFECLGHGDARGPAMEVLGRLLTDETLPAYIDALTSPNPAVVSGVTRVLGQGRGYDPAPFLDLLADPTLPKPVVEAVLAEQAAHMPAHRLVSALPGLSKDARGVVFRLLERRVDAGAIPAMLELVGHEDQWMRLYMVRLLGRFDDGRVVRALPRLLHDPHPGVRLEAVRSLRQLGARSQIAALVGVLRDEDLRVQTEAIDAVTELGDAKAVPHLLEVLQDESEQTRRGAVEVLNVLATTEAVQDLVRALRDADWWVRVRAADALGGLGGPRVVEAVVGLLGDEDEFIRRYAVEILNAVPSERAVEPLVHALRDPDWWVRERSIDALAKTGDPRAVDPLLELMGMDPSVAPLCARALGSLGDVRAAEPLRELTASDSEEVRREAVEALRLLSRKALSEEDRERVNRALAAVRVGESPAGAEGIPLRVGGREPRADPGTGHDRPLPPVPETAAPRAPGPGSGGAGATPGGTPAPDFRELVPGTILLHRYRVLEKIGRGGFGAIYLVEDAAVQDRIILKILNPHLSGDEAALTRFVQELKLTRRISHRNIIRIYDFIDLGSAHAVSMEYLPGRDLGRLMNEEGRLGPERCLGIAAQVCAGLAAAHAEGVIHRDIKPGNILVGADDGVKIVDFGLAWAERGRGSRLTKSGILIGTPEYMAPEQIQGEAVDHRLDLYSLGIVMYEMLTGRAPFTADTPVKILFQHLEGEAPDLVRLNPDTPPEVAALVGEAMARDPEARPATAEELRQRIEAARAALEPRTGTDGPHA